MNFPCSADHVEDWQPYPVDPYFAMCDDHTVHTCCRPDSRTCFFPSFPLLFIWRCLYFRVFLYHCPFPLCMESTSYGFSCRMLFFYLVTTGWIFDISLLYENSISQKVSRVLSLRNVVLGAPSREDTNSWLSTRFSRDVFEGVVDLW